MSLANSERFAVEALDLAPIEGGTSILLTGDDTDALEAVFHRLTAPADDERSVLLTTDTSGTAVKRALSGVARGADDRATVLACEGPDRGDDVETVDDITDLTGLGMEFSTLVAAATQDTEKFRAGILLCSTIMGEIEDTRSVYRFLNSNFLTELRRSGGVGVCAVDTSSDIGADMNSTIAGLETSFNARIHVESTGRNEATLDVSGLDGDDGTIDISW
ncbi:DUF7504 family protein [Halorientalis salina]|uniref:DUF7504 family protein n=1 Tax=Halorientalis salina TaxID=2932266 RepID=UPI0010ACD110|nr:hypothetical protein [Halorientalis salina]